VLLLDRSVVQACPIVFVALAIVGEECAKVVQRTDPVLARASGTWHSNSLMHLHFGQAVTCSVVHDIFMHPLIAILLKL